MRHFASQLLERARCPRKGSRIIILTELTLQKFTRRSASEFERRRRRPRQECTAKREFRGGGRRGRAGVGGQRRLARTFRTARRAGRASDGATPVTGLSQPLPEITDPEGDVGAAINIPRFIYLHYFCHANLRGGTMPMPRRRRLIAPAPRPPSI